MKERTQFLQQDDSLASASLEATNTSNQISSGLQSVSVAHIMTMIVFLLFVAVLLFLIKQHLVKFMGFFVIRKDYQRLKIAQQSQFNNENHSIESSPPVNKPQKQQKLCFMQQFKLTMIQNAYKYHPLQAIALQKYKARTLMIKLPALITLSFLLVILFTQITLSFTAANIQQSYCEDKRYYSSYSYLCQASQTQKVPKSAIAGSSIILAILIVPFSMLAIHQLSANYFKFMKKCSTTDQREDQSFETNKAHHPTMQNMLDSQEIATRKSMLKGQTSQFQDDSQKNLFQINEDEEELQQTKNNYSKSSILGENKNILNTQGSIIKLSSGNSPKVSAHKNENSEPPFCSNQKENNRPVSYETNRSKAVKFKNPKKSQLSTYGLTDSTSIIDGGNSINNQSSNKQLEGIQEEDLEKEGTFTQQRLKEAGFLHDNIANESFRIHSKEDVKEEDSSRINIINRDQDSQNKKDKKCLTVICDYVNPRSSYQNNAGLSESLNFGLFCLFVMLFALGLLFDLYCIFNNTTNAIQQALTIFGLILIFDLLLFRYLAIIGFSLVQTVKATKRGKQSFRKPIELESDTLYLLSQIYESYESQIIPAISQELHTQMLGDQDSDSSGRLSNAHNHHQNHSSNYQSRQPTVKRRQIGDLVLIESTYFYHGQDPSTILPHQLQAEEVHISNILQRSNKKKRPVNKGEKVKIAKTLAFNAENEVNIQKSHLEKARMSQDSHYDIEEIPLYSSRKRDIQRQNENVKDQEGSFTLPPINQQQQFETPRDTTSSRGKSKMIGVTQQIIQFNDLRESESKPKSFLRDLIGLSAGKSPLKNDYQSLKRYLDEDKENQLEGLVSARGGVSKSAIGLQSLKSAKKDENMPGFTPQYATNAKGSLLTKKIIDGKSDLRKSAHIEGSFADLRNVNICQDLEKRYNQKSLLKSGKRPSMFEENAYKSNKKSVVSNSTNFKQRSNQSPSIIKETLEVRMSQMKMQPNISPFNEHKLSQIKQSDYNTTDVLPFVNPFSPSKEAHDHSAKKGDLQFLIQPQFGNKTQNEKQIVQNLVIQEQPFQSIDVNQAKLLTTRNLGQKTIEDSIDAKVRQVIKGVKVVQEVNEQQDFTQRVIDSEEFHTDSEDQTLFQLQKIESKQELSKIMEEEKQEPGEEPQEIFKEVEPEPSLGQKELLNQTLGGVPEESSRYNETNRSRVYEDSDQSTFRMINFKGSKRADSGSHSKNQSANIDFYSQGTMNNSKVEASHFKSNRHGATQEVKPSYTSNIVLIQHSKKGSIQIMESADSDESITECNNTGIVTNLMNQLNSEDLKEAEDDEIEFKFCKRQTTKSQERATANNKKHRRGQDYGSFESKRTDSQEGTHHNLHMPPRPQIRKKADNTSEHLSLRVEEQRRKLKSFLKLAKQLKSTKDEAKIKELLLILKQTKKPLPMSQINELKQLEIMASPYNQSLIAMIKDEYDKQKNSAKPPSSQGKRNSRQQQKSQERTGAILKQLNNIYGQAAISSNSSFRNSKSREVTTRDGIESRFGTNKTSKGLVNLKHKTKTSHGRRHPSSHDSMDSEEYKQQRPIILQENVSSMSQLGLPTSESEGEDYQRPAPTQKSNFIEIQEDFDDYQQ